MKHRLLSKKVLAGLLVWCILGVAGIAFGADAPKYVFYFIGDGMGPAQRQAAQYFRKVETQNPDAGLVMDGFPQSALVTTHADNTLITDSAAGGTALATGYKTTNAVIAKLPDGRDVKTIAEAVREKGYAVGIATSVRISHATPAAFSAHNMSRSMENEIAVDQVNSGFEYYAGGGYRHFVAKDNPQGLKSKRKDDRDLVAELQEKKYTTFVGENSRDAFRALTPKKGEKVFAALAYSALAYEIDRKNSPAGPNAMPSLAELTDKGIEVLAAQEKPFFFMVEGGKIDWAAHCHDAAATIWDTLAFDDAIARAFDFYKKHPKETLIIVAADHETGGMAMGISMDSKGYFLKLAELLKVKVSTEDVLSGVYPKLYKEHQDKAVRQGLYLEYLAENFGLTDLTPGERDMLVQAMETEDKNQTLPSAEQTTYGYAYSPTMIAVGHLVSYRARLNWTSYVHTASLVSLSAMGPGAEEFSGFMDNTGIPKALAKIIGVKLSDFPATASKAMLGETVGPVKKYVKVPYL
ncbi:MAG: alkaline phosphatase [Desulfobacterales bacterium]|nr:alkaline phosphatase [Desulfobacterales bacterium]